MQQPKFVSFFILPAHGDVGFAVMAGEALHERDLLRPHADLPAFCLFQFNPETKAIGAAAKIRDAACNKSGLNAYPEKLRQMLLKKFAQIAIFYQGIS